MRYYHVNAEGKILIGKCLSILEKLEDGRLKFKDEWEWLSDDKSSAYSEIVEVDSL